MVSSAVPWGRWVAVGSPFLDQPLQGHVAHPEADLLDEEGAEDQSVCRVPERDEAPTPLRSDEASGEAGGSGADPFGRAGQY